MTRLAHLAVVVAVAVAAPLGSSPAYAAKPAKKAKKLAKKGTKLLKKKKWSKAAEVFDKAVALDPKPAYQLGLGKALEGDGRVQDAWERYQACADAEPACARGVDRAAKALGKTHNQLVVSATPQGARVRLDRGGKTVTAGPAPLTAWVEKGSWRLHVTMPGLSPDRRELSVPAGRKLQIAAKLRKPPDSPWSAALLQPPKGEPDAAAGAAYEAKGKAAYAKKRLSDAVAAFKLAYEADPQAKYLFNVGRGYEQLGELPKAVGFVERYVDEATDDAQRMDGRRLLEILRRKLADEWGSLVVNALPPGAAIQLTQGKRMESGATPLVRWLPVGAWELEVSAEGHVGRKWKVEVKAGKSRKLDVKLEAVAKPLPPKPPPVEMPPPPPDASGAGADAGSSTLGWALVGTGAVMLAAGGFFGLLGTQGNDDVDALGDGSTFMDDARSKHDAAQNKLLLAHGLAGAGLVAAGVGTWMLLQW